MSERYFAKIANILNSRTVVINKGASDGVKLGDKFVVVGLGQDIADPDTGEVIDKLEIVRGRGKVTHVQSKLATIESIELHPSSAVKKVTTKTPSFPEFMATLYGSRETVTETTSEPDMQKPFNSPVIGDVAIRQP